MSIPVALSELTEQVARFGAHAFLVTVDDDGRPHPASVLASVHDDGTVRMGAGRRTSTNATARPAVTVLWAGPVEGYALLVDGRATVDAGTLSLAPVSAMLHKVAEPA